MIILSEQEYLRAEHRLNSLISKGDQNLSHEERMEWEELMEAIDAWEDGKLSENDQKMVENIDKKYIRKGQVLYRHKHSKEFLKKFKPKK